MSYQINVLEPASKELEHLDKPVAQRIIRRIRWLADNINAITPQPLKADLTGFYKLRVGDYRVIYETLHSELTIIIHLIGHRRNIYKN